MWGAARSEGRDSIYITWSCYFSAVANAADLSMGVQAYASHVKSNMFQGGPIYHSLDL